MNSVDRGVMDLDMSLNDLLERREKMLQVQSERMDEYIGSFENIQHPPSNTTHPIDPVGQPPPPQPEPSFPAFVIRTKSIRQAKTGRFASIPNRDRVTSQHSINVSTSSHLPGSDQPSRRNEISSAGIKRRSQEWNDAESNE